MTHRKAFRYAPGLLLATGVSFVMLGGGCSAANQIAGAAQGCDEFSGGASSVASLQIDATTKTFLTSVMDLQSVATSMENSVYTACKGFDTALGVMDTWSTMKDLDDQTKEACAQAKAKIDAVLAAGASAQASCSLAISGGECQVSADAEATCEASCTGAASCTPPDITVACDPGELSGQCSGTCNASATCEGTAMLAAMCTGSCAADCQGTCDVTATTPKIHCTGTCMGNCTGTCDGSTTSGAACAGKCDGECDAQCKIAGGVNAHCDGTCTGSCTGDCKLAANANVNCGAMVNCKGGCSVTVTAPKCEGKITPPMCNVDANCQGSCQAHAEVMASCTPPSASLECSANATSDMQTLVTAVQANLPALLQAFQTQGQLAVDAAGQVISAGTAIAGEVTSLSGKAIACAGVAGQAAVSAQASINVSVSASASVSGSCGASSS